MARRRQGRYQEAAGYHRQALDLFRKIGDRDLEADALNGLGDVLVQIGDADKARAHHTMLLPIILLAVGALSCLAIKQARRRRSVSTRTAKPADQGGRS
jgi:tetratricopeptide (TPR) repeat protein